ncbi:hypothetical protein AgCh_019354 [Apium graveolens]
MGLKFEKEEQKNDKKDISTILKISLYNFPSKKKEPLGMLKPPMSSFASIPFKWEEASGKPRIIDVVATNARSSAVPSPRL